MNVSFSLRRCVCRGTRWLFMRLVRVGAALVGAAAVVLGITMATGGASADQSSGGKIEPKIIDGRLAGNAPWGGGGDGGGGAGVGWGSEEAAERCGGGGGGAGAGGGRRGGGGGGETGRAKGGGA